MENGADSIMKEYEQLKQQGKSVDYVKIGKYMSMILRHRPEVIGITLDEHGWADVNELIAGIARNNKFNREILDEIVRTDSKQRYSFNEDGTKIRANQGHSIHVDLGLQPVEPPEILWHGTAEKYVDSIDKTGLKPGNRMQVHLSPDRDTAERWEAGMGNRWSIK